MKHSDIVEIYGVGKGTKGKLLCKYVLSDHGKVSCVNQPCDQKAIRTAFMYDADILLNDCFHFNVVFIDFSQ